MCLWCVAIHAAGTKRHKHKSSGCFTLQIGTWKWQETMLSRQEKVRQWYKYSMDTAELYNQVNSHDIVSDTYWPSLFFNLFFRIRSRLIRGARIITGSPNLIICVAMTCKYKIVHVTCHCHLLVRGEGRRTASMSLLSMMFIDDSFPVRKSISLSIL